MQPVRLDRHLASRFPHYSRSYIKKLIEEGFVSVNGEEKRKASFIIRGGERIDVKRRAPEIPEAEPEAIPLEILHEDKNLVVINKHAGLVVHPAPGNYRGTLVSALLHHFDGNGHVGLVHRLDKGTSGVMVIAKDEMTQGKLAAQFKNRSIEKIYLALTFGRFQRIEGTISRPLGRDSMHRRKYSSRSRRPRDAVTHFRVLKEFSGISLVELKPETGRTHQIRVHLSEERHPILGDATYGANSFLSSIKDEAALRVAEGWTRPALHASELGFTHPATGEFKTFKAPLPADFQTTINILEGR